MEEEGPNALEVEEEENEAHEAKEETTSWRTVKIAVLFLFLFFSFCSLLISSLRVRRSVLVALFLQVA